MKFGKQFEEYEFPEWRGHYIPYNVLKKDLEEKRGIGPTPPLNSPATSPKCPKPQSSAFSSAGMNWLQWVEAEAVRVGEFVDRGMTGLEAQLDDLSQMAEKIDKRKGSEIRQEQEEGSFLELRVLEALGKVTEGLQRLRGFAELNHAALYKILKKHDKVNDSCEGLDNLFPRLVKQTRLADTKRMDLLDEKIETLSLRNSKTKGLDMSLEVARLVEGLGRGPTTSSNAPGGRTSTAYRTELIFTFFLGSSTALLFSIFVILALPAQKPESFFEEYFYSPIPVFRVIFSLLLTLWCLGAVVKTCDTWNINHIFLLKIDPRWRVSPEFFFSRAATLTTTWMLIFGMYVVDYKWEVVHTIWGTHGGARFSRHFVLYPVVLLAFAIVGMLWPSRLCRNRYKFAILRSVKRTAAAPFYPVDFADNLMGDIITSMAKPLQDVPAAFCYFASSHPLSEARVEQFRYKGDICKDSTHQIIMPMIAGFPYVFRALQCLRRFHDTGERRHLWNFGKYISCLLVVVVSTQSSSLTVIAIVSAIATVYASCWDVAIDWALGEREFFVTAKFTKRGSKTQQELTRIRTHSGHVTVQPARTEDHEKRLFSPRINWLCSLFDIAARSTWVLTLMPITIITRSFAGQAMLVAFISSVEIIRRSVWTVLRFENEQVTNAGGFRALLWVPSKLKAVEKDQKPHEFDEKKQPLLEPDNL